MITALITRAHAAAHLARATWLVQQPLPPLPCPVFADGTSAESWVRLSREDDLVLVPLRTSSAYARTARLAWISPARRSKAVFLNVQASPQDRHDPRGPEPLQISVRAEHEGWVMQAANAPSVPHAIAWVALQLGVREVLVGVPERGWGSGVTSALASVFDRLLAERISQRDIVARRLARERRRLETSLLRKLVSLPEAGRTLQIEALFARRREEFDRSVPQRRPLPSLTWAV